MSVNITVSNSYHAVFAEEVCSMMSEAAKIRGTGIAKRDSEYIQLKITKGDAVIALKEDKVVGFCYIESWENQNYVANSGLIVHPEFRNTGLAKKIKQAIFDLSKKKYPSAKLFGITTSMAVMKINSELGYKPVTFSNLTKDDKFWNGCKSCTNYDILQRTNKTMCICTGMIYDLSNASNDSSTWDSFKTFIKKRKEKIKTKAKQFPLLNKITNNEK